MQSLCGTLCPDVNECDRMEDNCDINAECSNTIGSYRCSCNMGYTGSGIMSDCSKSCKDAVTTSTMDYSSLQYAAMVMFC